MAKLSLNLTPTQSKFVSSSYKHPAMVGGWGSGKTYGLAWRLVLKHLSGRQGKIDTAFYGFDYPTLMVKPYEAIRNALDEARIKHQFRKGEYRFDLGKYGNIYLKSFHDPSKIRSVEFHHIVIDELEQLPLTKAKFVFEQILGRARGIEGTTIGVGTTPDFGTGGFLASRWGGTGPVHSPEYKAYHAPTRENVFMEGLDEYIQSVRENYAYDEKLAELYLLGKFVVLGDGLVYEHYVQNQSSVHVPPPQQVPDTISVGIDFNVGACFSVVAAYINDELTLLDEVVGNDTENLCHRLKAKYPNRSIIAYPDATGKSRSTNASKTDLQILQNEGLQVSASNINPRITDRVNCVNKAFATGKLKLVKSRVPLLHHALSSHAYKDGAPEKAKEHKKGEGSLDDRTDALGYLVYKLLPLAQPVFRTGFTMRG